MAADYLLVHEGIWKIQYKYCVLRGLPEENNRSQNHIYSKSDTCVTWCKMAHNILQSLLATMHYRWWARGSFDLCSAEEQWLQTDLDLTKGNSEGCRGGETVDDRM